jgi:hypothetical protein
MWLQDVKQLTTVTFLWILTMSHLLIICYYLFIKLENFATLASIFNPFYFPMSLEL